MKLFYRVRFGKLREENRVIEKQPPSAPLEGKMPVQEEKGKRRKTITGKTTSLTGSMIFFISELIFMHLFSLILKLKMNREWHGNKEFEIASFFS